LTAEGPFACLLEQLLGVLARGINLAAGAADLHAGGSLASNFIFLS
jgi:hypothetical protein